MIGLQWVGEPELSLSALEKNINGFLTLGDLPPRIWIFSGEPLKYKFLQLVMRPPQGWYVIYETHE